MKLLVQWSTATPNDFVEVDSVNWSKTAKRPDPTGGTPTLDSSAGWIHTLSVQGVKFQADHYAVEELNDGSGGIRVTAWNDAPEFDGDELWAQEWTFHHIQPDLALGGAYNTKQVQTMYCAPVLLARLQLPQHKSQRILKPLSEFRSPPAKYVRHGVMMTDTQYEAHVVEQRKHSWREWTEGVPAQFISIEGKIKPMRDLGLYAASEFTRTWYPDNSALVGFHSADQDESMTESVPSGSDGVQISCSNMGANSDRLGFAFTAKSFTPFNDAWPTGDYRFNFDCQSVGAGLSYGARQAGSTPAHFGRIEGDFSGEAESKVQIEDLFTGNGIKLATTGSISWSAGDTLETLEVIIAIVRDGVGHGNQTMDISVDDTDTWVDAPFNSLQVIDPSPPLPSLSANEPDEFNIASGGGSQTISAITRIASTASVPGPAKVNLKVQAITAIASGATVPGADQVNLTVSAITRIESTESIPTIHKVVDDKIITDITAITSTVTIPTTHKTNLSVQAITQITSTATVPGAEQVNLKVQDIGVVASTVVVSGPEQVALAVQAITRIESTISVPTTHKANLSVQSVTRIESTATVPGAEQVNLTVSAITQITSTVLIPTTHSVLADQFISAITRIESTATVPGADKINLSVQAITRIESTEVIPTTHQINQTIDMVNSLIASTATVPGAEQVNLTVQSITRIESTESIPTTHNLAIDVTIADITRIESTSSVSNHQVDLTIRAVAAIVSTATVPGPEKVNLTVQSVTRIESTISIPTTHKVLADQFVAGITVITSTAVVPGPDQVSLTVQAITAIVSTATVPGPEKVNLSVQSITRIESTASVSGADQVNLTIQAITTITSTVSIPTTHNLAIDETISAITRIESTATVPGPEKVNLSVQSITRIESTATVPGADQINLTVQAITRIESTANIPGPDQVSLTVQAITRIESTVSIPTTHFITTGAPQTISDITRIESGANVPGPAKVNLKIQDITAITSTATVSGLEQVSLTVSHTRIESTATVPETHTIVGGAIIIILPTPTPTQCEIRVGNTGNTKDCAVDGGAENINDLAVQDMVKAGKMKEYYHVAGSGWYSFDIVP